MTTIAYRAGILAADTLAVVGNYKDPCPQEKVIRLKDNSLVCVTGAFCDLQRFADYLDGKVAEKPDLEESTVIHFISQDEIWVYELNGRFRFTGEFCSWGSGKAAADAAMLLGKSSAEAVDVAKLVDVYTGGQTRTYHVPART